MHSGGRTGLTACLLTLLVGCAAHTVNEAADAPASTRPVGLTHSQLRAELYQAFAEYPDERGLYLQASLVIFDSLVRCGLPEPGQGNGGTVLSFRSCTRTGGERSAVFEVENPAGGQLLVTYSADTQAFTFSGPSVD